MHHPRSFAVRRDRIALFAASLFICLSLYLSVTCCFPVISSHLIALCLSCFYLLSVYPLSLVVPCSSVFVVQPAWLGPLFYRNYIRRVMCACSLCSCLPDITHARRHIHILIHFTLRTTHLLLPPPLHLSTSPQPRAWKGLGMRAFRFLFVCFLLSVPNADVDGWLVRIRTRFFGLG